ncbi:MAG: hypothetical protein ACYCZW_03845 [Minisyncoccota bacterium]
MVDLEQKIKDLEKQNNFLSAKIAEYENGDNNLYHAVRRKMSEYAILLNKTKVQDIDLDNKDGKTFERITAILEKCEKIAVSASALGVRSGAEQVATTVNQTVVRKPYTPEDVANEVGELAGRKQ